MLLKNFCLFVDCTKREFHFELQKGALDLISFRNITLKSHSEPEAENWQTPARIIVKII